ncbi:NADH-quinone oxidoreductase subunit L [Kibdelosporangium persicum]|uniref:NADH-ubiquinone oxidoreductase chain L n=1 Tax=Kibdelosporangium persicum TaxID=2698649 RepID=A0ABX2FCA2_9PSEU|nr:NADH-quinone oxidoreductase subunit L [Kibdelosporangium persicum]NRN68996.1 NADH-ubiquinone oxidoreductase chain L [Kibdelosporangium persicum]
MTAPLVILGTAISAVCAVVLALLEPFETYAVLTPTGTIPITMGLRVDELSSTVAVMVTLVALAIQIYSVGYMRHDVRYPAFAILVALFTLAMLTVVLSADLLVLYVGWEIMGVCSYFLIGHHWEKPSASAAAVKSFLMTRFGDVGFLFGIFVLGGAAGSFRITDVIAAVPAMSPGTLLTGSLLLLAGIIGKSAQFPLHSWLPDAMAGPAPVSALIHAATMVAAGAYVVALLYPVFLAAPLSLDVLAVIAVVSMIGSALAALVTDDLKRVLAYSTISQLSVMFAALAVGGRTQAIAHLLSHAAFKALLFLCAGAVIIAVGSNLMADMGGLRRGMPLSFLTMTVGFAALAGIPPTAGFFSKDAVVAAAEHAPHWFVFGGLLLTVGLTAAYTTRAWLRTFFGSGPDAGEASKIMTIPLTLLASAALLLGFVGLRFEELRPEVLSAVLSLVLAALGALAVFMIWRRDPARDPADALGRARRVFGSAFGTDDLYERTVARGVVRVANEVVRVDDSVVARSVRGTGRGARALGGLLRLTQNGNPQFYVTALLAGVVVIAVGVVVLQ